MATQATSTAPIGIFQINHYYYVGQDAVNIQQAVNFAVADGNAGTVVIPQEYAGADTIAAVVNGSTSVYIMDERGGQRQAYLWVNTAYVAEPILPVGVGTPQINHQLFVGPLGKFPTIQSAITFAVASGGMYAIIIPQTYAGSEDIATLTGGASNVYLSDQRTYQWQNYYWTGTIYAPINVVQLGSLTVNGDIFATGNLDAANAAITGDITADGIQANDAEFETCIVDNSPVRTFANTADGPSQGMIWPEFGVPISEGDHWRDPSIDPATLAIWPPVGIPVSTGAAWGTSIDPATIPRLNTANVFTGLNTIASLHVTQAFQATMNNGSNPPVVAPSSGGFALGWNSQPGNGETDFINSNNGAGGGFNWYNVGGGVSIGPTTTPSMLLDSANALHVAGDIGTNEDIYVAGISHLSNGHLLIGTRSGTILTGVPVICNDNSNLYFNSAANGFSYFNFDLGGHGVKFCDGTGSGTAVGSIDQSGNASFNGNVNAPNGSVTADSGSFWSPTHFAQNSLQIGYRIPAVYNSNVPNINTESASVYISPSAGHNVYMCWDQVGTTQFGNGVGGPIASIDSAGNGNFSGQLTAVTKSFLIPHPLDDTKNLMHSCLEGPEFGVYYRGEAVTKDGAVAITLPDYFEALTRKEGRTIQLTELYDDEREPMFGNFIAAGRINNGKFNVRTTSKVAVKFYWEVKAVRRDVEPLEVKTKKREIPRGPETTDDAGADRDGEVEVREPKSKKVRA